MRLFAVSAGLIAYVFLGYPAIAALLARLRPRPVAADRQCTPAISVVIAAYNEAEVIDAKIENTLALDYPAGDMQVIVVTDGSTDDTPSRARRHSGIAVLHDPVRRGKASAMTRAARRATGEVLVFSDANNLLDRGALRALLAPFADATVGCVTGRKAIDDGSGRPVDAAEGLYWRYESRIRGWESRFGSVTGVNGELLALRREAFHALPEGTVNDDVTLALGAAAAGWRIAYAPDALSLERASACTRGESARRSRIAAGRYQALARLGPRLARRQPLVAWQLLSHKALRLAVSPAMAGALAGSLRIRRRGAKAALLGIQGAFYGAALAGWAGERNNARRRATYLPYYFCRMNLANVAGLAQFLSRPGARIARWQRVERG